MSRSFKRKKRHVLAVITAAAVTAFFIAGIFAFSPPVQRLIYPTKYSDIVEKYASKNGLDKYFVYAVIKTESNFDPKAESDVGARGLMQLMEVSYDWVKFRMNNDDMSVYGDLYDPEKNIKYGTYLLKLLYEEYGCKETAAAAYHTGRGRVNTWLADDRYSSDGKNLDDIPSKVTKHYVSKVMKAYDKYVSLYSK